MATATVDPSCQILTAAVVPTKSSPAFANQLEGSIPTRAAWQIASSLGTSTGNGLRCAPRGLARPLFPKTANRHGETGVPKAVRTVGFMIGARSREWRIMARLTTGRFGLTLIVFGPVLVGNDLAASGRNLSRAAVLSNRVPAKLPFGSQHLDQLGGRHCAPDWSALPSPSRGERMLALWLSPVRHFQWDGAQSRVIEGREAWLRLLG